MSADTGESPMIGDDEGCSGASSTNGTPAALLGLLMLAALALNRRRRPASQLRRVQRQRRKD